MHKPTHTTPDPKPSPRARRAGTIARGAYHHKARAAKRSSTPPRRRRNQKPIKWTPIVLRLAAIIVVVTGITLALTSPGLMIRHLDVQGTRTVSPQEIGTLAAVPGRKNIFRYYLAQHRALARRVMRGEPAVAETTVALRLPDTLVVRVTEREPYALLQAKDGTGWLLDPNAVPYRRLPHDAVAAVRSELPCVAITSVPDTLVLGRSLAPDVHASVASAYALLDALKQTPCPSLANPSRIVVDQYANVSLILANGLSVKLGQPEGLPSKLAQVQATLDADNSLTERAQYLDFTSPRPAWMPRPPVAQGALTKEAQDDSHGPL